MKRENDLKTTVTAEHFTMMQAVLLPSKHGSDRIPDAYYDALDILKMSGVTHIGETPICDY